jgi:hypothetical protein
MQHTDHCVSRRSVADEVPHTGQQPTGEALEVCRVRRRLVLRIGALKQVLEHAGLLLNEETIDRRRTPLPDDR